ncbi:LAME_0E01002g1_1 [Lachancea meyersii CBS 8951]|uniref:LAME_0E01002g1_1 n=1 Tax=Lachancea meyersii CBS 8951 TaxID=1266667 RepID=A0A1G4JEP3_9SACH|nr:LAME_0E01002g1_1 [Lachancea meyersii CBS 8951]
MSVPKGLLVDNQSRCVHWNSKLDVVCFRFKCCDRYYACHSCHDFLEEHPIQRYKVANDSTTHVVLCGVCRNTMTFDQYRNGLTCGSNLQCPFCSAPFNPNCKLHYNIYFDI